MFLINEIVNFMQNKQNISEFVKKYTLEHYKNHKVLKINGPSIKLSF